MGLFPRFLGVTRKGVWMLRMNSGKGMAGLAMVTEVTPVSSQL